MTTLKDILGGEDEIRKNAEAWITRTQNAPFLDKEKQPILYKIAERIAKERGLTVEELQRKTHWD